MTDSQTRKCDDCGRGEPEVKFYRTHPTCKTCMMDRAKAVGAARNLSLEQKVELHKQERMLKAEMRAELRRVAKKRLADRRAAKKARARAAIMPKPTGEQIVVNPEMRELAQRELSRRRLIEFIQEFHPRYLAGWVHHDICRRLEQFLADVAAGKNPRLMLLMPPRHGKSQIASKMLPPWALGHYPHFEIIACSYNITLALEFSREARGIVRSDRYATLFPNAKLDPEYAGAEAWKLLSPTGVGAGGYVAAGIGGPITGKGAHVLIIDDPIKNAEEAESLEQRQKIWDWYRSTAYTRLAPGGGVLVIQTWWHDDDLAGRLQEEMKNDPEADQFEIVKYPAVAMEDEEFRSAGEALHPERYDIEQLNRIKRTIGNRYWSALYQQDPVPDEGAYFTKDMIIYRNHGLDLRSLHLYQAWDFAISEKRNNDWNVGVTVGLDYEDVAHVVEIRRFKTNDSGRIADEILGMYAAYPQMGPGSVHVVGVEDGQIWRTMGAILKKRMAERRVYPNFEVQKPLTDKQVRARPLQARMQHGKVTFPATNPHLEAVVKELMRFPAGTHDDCVDALAWVITLIIGKSPPPKPAPPKKRGEKTLAEKLRSLGRTRGSGAMSA